MSQPKLCDDSAVIAAVQAHIARIKNPEKRAYAEAFWAAVYNEAAHGVTSYPDSSQYRIGYMTAEAVRLRIGELITAHRSTY